MRLPRGPCFSLAVPSGFVPIFRDSRYAKRGKVEGAIRVVEGEHDGLSARWVGGVATLTPGVIEFVGTYGLRFPYSGTDVHGVVRGPAASLADPLNDERTHLDVWGARLCSGARLSG